MAEVDRLIDEGLNRYGTGDLDGALEAWEDALALEPDNPQANSYVDYVRQNYDILATDGGVAVTDSPVFGIESEPEYTIEITAGEVTPPSGEPVLDDLDGGWFIDDDDPHTVHVGRAPSRDNAAAVPRTLEMEADEPPPVGISFDETTREYYNQKPPTDEFADEPSFRGESTPVGFAAQETEIKPRNTGFVQPVARKVQPQPPVPSPGGEPPTNTAELRVRVRTPSSTPPLSKPVTAVPAPAPEPLSLELDPLELELSPSDRSSPAAPPEPAPAPAPEPEPPAAEPAEVDPFEATTADDLLGSLPIPRRMTPVRGSRASVPPLDPLDDAQAESRIPTRDLPEPRPPAAIAAELTSPTAKTRDLAREGAAEDGPIGGDDPVIGQPTRELGLRPLGGKRAPSVFPDEDATTTQSDASQFRREAAEAQRAATVTDDIDARGAQILAEIDEGVAPNESKDEHVRRRISGLIMRAAEWNASGDLDRAVTAVDLALSEDPTSALAQKLVHRNREAIMNVFQSYLGDLDRQPQLAKPLHELASSPIGPRAAFLLSRIDGMLSIDEILDVSGMPRLEAYRHLCQLFLRGILR
ncbi:MAG TPA: hypothetical protein VGL61_02405 [Kofleriaceae bacterium]